MAVCTVHDLASFGLATYNLFFRIVRPTHVEPFSLLSTSKNMNKQEAVTL